MVRKPGLVSKPITTADNDWFYFQTLRAGSKVTAEATVPGREGFKGGFVGIPRSLVFYRCVWDDVKGHGPADAGSIKLFGSTDTAKISMG